MTQDFQLRHPSKALLLYEKWPKLSKILFAFSESIHPLEKLRISKNSDQLTDGKLPLLQTHA